MLCGYCNATVGSTAKFCGKCGSRIRCEQCRTTLKLGAKFCGSCRHPTSGNVSIPTPTADAASNSLTNAPSKNVTIPAASKSDPAPSVPPPASPKSKPMIIAPKLRSSLSIAAAQKQSSAETPNSTISPAAAVAPAPAAVVAATAPRRYINLKAATTLTMATPVTSDKSNTASPSLSDHDLAFSSSHTSPPRSNAKRNPSTPPPLVKVPVQPTPAAPSPVSANIVSNPPAANPVNSDRKSSPPSAPAPLERGPRKQPIDPRKTSPQPPPQPDRVTVKSVVQLVASSDTLHPAKHTAVSLPSRAKASQSRPRSKSPSPKIQRAARTETSPSRGRSQTPPSRSRHNPKRAASPVPPRRRSPSPIRTNRSSDPLTKLMQVLGKQSAMPVDTKPPPSRGSRSASPNSRQYDRRPRSKSRSRTPPPRNLPPQSLRSRSPRRVRPASPPRRQDTRRTTPPRNRQQHPSRERSLPRDTNRRRSPSPLRRKDPPPRAHGRGRDRSSDRGRSDQPPSRDARHSDHVKQKRHSPVTSRPSPPARPTGREFPTAANIASKSADDSDSSDVSSSISANDVPSDYDEHVDGPIISLYPSDDDCLPDDIRPVGVKRHKKRPQQVVVSNPALPESVKVHDPAVPIKFTFHSVAPAEAPVAMPLVANPSWIEKEEDMDNDHDESQPKEEVPAAPVHSSDVYDPEAALLNHVESKAPVQQPQQQHERQQIVSGSLPTDQSASGLYNTHDSAPRTTSRLRQSRSPQRRPRSHSRSRSPPARRPPSPLPRQRGRSWVSRDRAQSHRLSPRHRSPPVRRPSPLRNGHPSENVAAASSTPTPAHNAVSIVDEQTIVSSPSPSLSSRSGALPVSFPVAPLIARTRPENALMSNATIASPPILVSSTITDHGRRVEDAPPPKATTRRRSEETQLIIDAYFSDLAAEPSRSLANKAADLLPTDNLQRADKVLGLVRDMSFVLPRLEDISASLQILIESIRNGQVPSATELGSEFQRLANAGHLNQIRLLFDELRHFVEGESPHPQLAVLAALHSKMSSVCSVVLACLCASGDWKSVVAFLDSLKQQHLKPDAASVELMLNLAGSNRDKLAKVLSRICSGGSSLHLSALGYAHVTKHLVAYGLYDALLYLFKTQIDHGVASPALLTSLLQLLSGRASSTILRQLYSHCVYAPVNLLTPENLDLLLCALSVETVDFHAIDTAVDIVLHCFATNLQVPKKGFTQLVSNFFESSSPQKHHPPQERQEHETRLQLIFSRLVHAILKEKAAPLPLLDHPTAVATLQRYTGDDDADASLALLKCAPSDCPSQLAVATLQLSMQYRSESLEFPLACLAELQRLGYLHYVSSRTIEDLLNICGELMDLAAAEKIMALPLAGLNVDLFRMSLSHIQRHHDALNRDSADVADFVFRLITLADNAHLYRSTLAQELPDYGGLDIESGLSRLELSVIARRFLKQLKAHWRGQRVPNTHAIIFRIRDSNGASKSLADLCSVLDNDVKPKLQYTTKASSGELHLEREHLMSFVFGTQVETPMAHDTARDVAVPSSSKSPANSKPHKPLLDKSKAKKAKRVNGKALLADFIKELLLPHIQADRISREQFKQLAQKLTHRGMEEDAGLSDGLDAAALADHLRPVAKRLVDEAMAPLLNV